MLTKVLTYHVVPGKVTSKDLKKMIKDGGGKAEIKTVEGGTITAMLQGGKIVLTDEKGRHIYGDDCRCVSVQWRYSRCRYGADAKLMNVARRVQLRLALPFSARPAVAILCA